MHYVNERPLQNPRYKQIVIYEEEDGSVRVAVVAAV